MLFDPSFSTGIVKLVAMKIGVKIFVEIRTLRFEDRKYKRQKLVYGKKKKRKIYLSSYDTTFALDEALGVKRRYVLAIW